MGSNGAGICVLVVGRAMSKGVDLVNVLSSLPDFPCRVRQAAHINGARERLGQDTCDAILVEWNGVEEITQLAMAAPAAAILILARADQEIETFLLQAQLLALGVGDILFLDNIGEVQLRRSLRAALARRQVLPALASEIAIEIAKRQAAEAALVESERQLQDFVTASPDWIWEMGTDFRFTRFGGRLHEALGLDPADLIGIKWAGMKAAPGDSPEAIAAHMEDLRARRPFRDFQYTYIPHEGSPLYFRASGKPIYGPDGEFMGYRGTAINSTAEVLAEQRALRAQIQLCDAIESISEGFILHDAEGRLVLCNSKFKEMYSLIAEALTPGISFASIARLGVERGQYMDLEGGSQEYVRRRLKQRVSSGCTFVQHLIGDRWIQVSERRTGDGGTVSIRTDITALRKTQEELRAAKEDAESANRTKSDFLANMSHELRTPLNAIMGFAETMHLEIFGPISDLHYKEYVHDIHSSASHLLGLINDLLDIAKIESGKFELFCERIAPAPLLDSCIQLMREGAETASITLTAQFADALPDIIADERRLKQVVLNLLANAVKFTPKGGAVTVTIHGDGLQNLPGGLTITVSDTGIGIAPEDIPIALTAFGQVHSTYTRTIVGAGTGLGLPLSRRLIEMHGGDLTLASVIGKGTIVTIWLPPDRLAPGLLAPCASM